MLVLLHVYISKAIFCHDKTSLAASARRIQSSRLLSESPEPPSRILAATPVASPPTVRSPVRRLRATPASKHPRPCATGARESSGPRCFVAALEPLTTWLFIRRLGRQRLPVDMVGAATEALCPRLGTFSPDRPGRMASRDQQDIDALAVPIMPHLPSWTRNQDFVIPSLRLLRPSPSIGKVHIDPGRPCRCSPRPNYIIRRAEPPSPNHIRTLTQLENNDAVRLRDLHFRRSPAAAPNPRQPCETACPTAFTTAGRVLFRSHLFRRSSL